jgi:hypothetical protein
MIGIGMGILRTGRASGSSFAVTDLGSKLKGWYREDKTLATGVSQWTDKSGGGNHWTQATGANQPAFSASGGPNGRACIQGNGSSKKMVGPALNAVMSTTAKELYLVMKLNSIATDDATATNNRAVISDDNGVFYITCRSTGPAIQWVHYDGSLDTTPNATLAATGSWSRVRIRHDGSSTFVKVGSGTEQTIASGTSSVFTAAMNLFYNVSTGEYLDADIAEIVFCNAELSGGERSDMDAYHASYFGLTV